MKIINQEEPRWARDDKAWQIEDLKIKRKAFLNAFKDFNPVGHKLAKWISVRDYIKNGWKSCLDSHMQLIIDEWPTIDKTTLYQLVYQWVKAMEGESKMTDDDKRYISKLVNSYTLF